MFSQDLVSASTLHKRVIHIAPAPIFAGLKRLHNRVLRLVEMFGGVFVPGRVAAADVATDQTFAQMNPAITHRQTFFAAIGARLDGLDLIQVRTW